MSFLPKIKRRDKYVGEAGQSGYRRYKLEISLDCRHRCVYCDLHANNLGGYPLMELDHFRPKAPDLFPHLKEDPFNLLFSCRSCNGKKRDDWPAGTGDETHIDGVGYVDPFDDRQQYFGVDHEGKMFSKKAPAQYVIAQLALNRPLAVAVRRRTIFLSHLNQAAKLLEAEHNELLNNAEEVDRARLKEIVRLLGQIRSKIIKQIDSEGAAI